MGWQAWTPSRNGLGFLNIPHTQIVFSKVVDSVPFRLERTENLVPVYKLVRGNPPFHLRSNFEMFRVITDVSVNFESFQLVYFLWDFFFSLLSTSLISPPPAAASWQGAWATMAPPLVHQALAISPWEHGGRSTVFPFLSFSLLILFWMNDAALSALPCLNALTEYIVKWKLFVNFVLACTFILFFLIIVTFIWLNIIVWLSAFIWLNILKNCVTFVLLFDFLICYVMWFYIM